MRLKRIKLAGFKSFVDPTVVPFQDNLTAIVGPNGCGKSNVIDAVRWVLGESSARKLRGESMSDVIFNGSANRKPLGQSAIELIFDNSDASVGGEYAKYNEIAIRREVNREGISNYYLNTTRCRRRDIIDIFLGTGLGTNSYAIVEQGMISDLIEAKPQELRLHLEEAAGVSRYKERRHETEIRIEHTLENLKRLNDIRQELENQLKVLKKQANAAAVYKRLREEERLNKAKLQSIYWINLHRDLSLLNQKITDKEVFLESKASMLSAVETVLENLRAKQIVASDEFNLRQSAFYRLGAAITELEQRIHYDKERQAELNQELMRLKQNDEETNQHLTNDSGQINLLELEETELTLSLKDALRIYEEAHASLLLAEETMRVSQAELENFNRESMQCTSEVAVAKTRLAHLKLNLENEEAFLVKILEEKKNFDFSSLEQEVISLQNKEAEFVALNQEQQKKQNELHNTIIHARENNQKLSKELDEMRSKAQKLIGQKAALESLQKNAFGNSDNNLIENWLKENKLHERPRFATEIKVERGFERAVELVLKSYLDAICLDDFESLADLLVNLPERSGNHLSFLTGIKSNADRFLEVSAKQEKNATEHNHKNTLLSKVNSSWQLDHILKNIFIATNLTEALKIRLTLKAHESVITPDGIWLGKNWVRVALQDESDEKSGILQRQVKMSALQGELTTSQESIKELENKLQKNKQELLNLEKDQSVLQHDFQEFLQKKNAVSSAYSVQQTKLQHLRERDLELQQKIVGYQKSIEEKRVEIIAAENSYKDLLEKQSKHESVREALMARRDIATADLTRVREQASTRKASVDAMQLRVEIIRNQILHLRQNLERAQKQLESFKIRRLEIEESLLKLASPEDTLGKELETKLNEKIDLEKNLLTAKNILLEVENELRVKDKERSFLQEEISKIRAELEAMRINRQDLEVRSEHHAAEVVELGFELDKICVEMLPGLATDELNPELDDLNPEIINDKLASVARRIERLGPINLAAVDEYNKQKERKEYLDKHDADLNEALTSLKQAIHKIDQETKMRLKDTFEKVNANLQELFPKIFQGGKASLQFTEDDLLNSGVMILAQPFGKRNSSIHLLSGGEKALTAIALIFSIFKINPAPFCMLDEVDAPFDDENVQRFCRLVKEMSDTIQFIYITHNKLTMEMASQLLGVTMHEPGVSRLVAVDISQAVKMAEK